MSLSIVFPALNEELNLPALTSEALEYLDGKDGEIIVVNDGSRDQTGTLIDELEQRHPGRIRAVHHPQNLGYAAALRTGFAAARSEWIFYTDADGQFDLREIDRLLALAENTDIVVGYRMDRKDPKSRIFAAGVFNRLARILFGISVRDIDCAFKLFRREIFDRIHIQSSGFLVDTEILAKAKKQGMIVRETGVTHHPRKQGSSTVRISHVFQTIKGLSWLLKELARP